MNKAKKLITGIVAMSLLLSVPVAGAATIESNGSQSTYSVTSEPITGIKTPAEYIEYLKKLQVESASVQEIQSLQSPVAAIEQSNVNEFLNQFLNLSEEKQQKFVDYLNDPEFLKTALTALNETTEGSQTFYDGDLVVRASLVDVTSSPLNVTPMAKGDTQDHSWYHQATTELMGIDFVKTRVELSVRTTEVQTNASQITSINHGRGILVQNYVPLAHIVKSEYPVAISADKTSARFVTDWSWNFVWDKLGLQVGTKRQWVQVTKAGKGTGGISNL